MVGFIVSGFLCCRFLRVSFGRFGGPLNFGNLRAGQIGEYIYSGIRRINRETWLQGFSCRGTFFFHEEKKVMFMISTL